MIKPASLKYYLFFLYLGFHQISEPYGMYVYLYILSVVREDNIKMGRNIETLCNQFVNSTDKEIETLGNWAQNRTSQQFFQIANVV
jgi:hypothetical protein